MNHRSREETALLSAVRSFGRRVESGLTRQVVRRLESLATDSSDGQREAALAIAIGGEAASHAGRLLRAWRKAQHITPQALAWALASADVVDDWHRRTLKTDLVWTGPLGPSSSFRRTDQALLEVIQGARHRLLIVSFAVYRVDVIERALIEAVRRGVAVQLVLETHEESRGRFDGDALSSLHPELLSTAEVFVWPFARRPVARTEKGQLWGVLHAKCGLADDRILFVSSANLTGAALALNIELGVLVEGGSLPKEVGRHFNELIQHGVLARTGV